MKQTNTENCIFTTFRGYLNSMSYTNYFCRYFVSIGNTFMIGVRIGSIYGAPADCIWGGGRIGDGDHSAQEVLHLMQEYGISARLTFSNSLLQEEHLSDKKCNALCTLFEKGGTVQNGVIVHSDLLLSYLKKQYPGLYLASSTTRF